MEREAFYEAFRRLLAELRPEYERPGADAHLWADGYLDSFAMVQVLQWLEELVGDEFELGADALPNFFTMERIYDNYVAGAA